MTKEDIIFTAGFFLGESYISVRLDMRGKFIGVVSISQLDREPLDKLQRLWGGTIEVFKTNGKPSTWLWRCNGGKALLCLEAVLPVMRNWSAFNVERIEKYIEFYTLDSANRRKRLWIIAWFQTNVKNHKRACHEYIDACYEKEETNESMGV